MANGGVSIEDDDHKSNQDEMLAKLIRKHSF